MAIAKVGGIVPLVVLVTSGSAVVQEQAGTIVGSVGWGNEANQAAIAKAGGIGPLVGLLTSGSVQAQEYAAGALRRLAENHEVSAAIQKCKAGGPVF